MTDDPTDDDGTASAPAKGTTGITCDVDETDLPSEVVVRAVAALTNTSVIDLDPLYDVVDPAHLDGLFERTGDGGAVEGSSITFDFNGCRVTVTGDTVSVHANGSKTG